MKIVIKKMVPAFLALILVFSMTACSSQTSDNNSSDKQQTITDVQESSEAEMKVDESSSGADDMEDSDSSKESSKQGSNILIAYFSMPEDVDVSGVDAVAGASVVVKDGKKLGNVEYVAGLIQQTIGGDLFCIETVQQYPLDHDPLVDQASDEQDENARPELAAHIENLDQYDTIILGFPNWWADLPMPLYTFLEEYDFSKKMIIPFVTHGGSGFSRTRNTIADLQPNAQVSDNTLSRSRNNVANSEDKVIQWAASLID